ncbi:type II toxin-antitoxin system YafO family toxin [Microbulbifer sp. EKSA005]|uniref:type II toxin-antitoxin system YafO family toxin n=1 Tax=Microbulbifer sp. EKSA005 TaxID=3243364 RepID=UPI0040424DFD
MEVKVFISPNLRETCDKGRLSTLVRDFKKYKIEGIKPEIFGRDVPYEFPASVAQADMHHIHVKDGTSKKWHIQKLDFYKTSNTAIIYCKGFKYINYYCLLGFLVEAHETYKSNPMYLLNLAEEAERFRSKF